MQASQNYSFSSFLFKPKLSDFVGKMYRYLDAISFLKNAGIPGMLCKRNIWAGWLLLAFLFGCAPKTVYVPRTEYIHKTECVPKSECVPKTEYDAIAVKYRLIQDQMSANEEKTKKLEQQLYEMRQDEAKLEIQIKTLKKTIRKKETIISLQGKVIKLLDDPNQTLQKSIEEQIATPNNQEERPSASP